MSQYAAQIYEEIMSIRGRVGLQLAKLHRNKVPHFDREPPTAIHRSLYCTAIVDWIERDTSSSRQKTCRRGMRRACKPSWKG